MPVYALAQITIHDRERYDRYASRFAAVFAQFNGRALAADESPLVVEGEWPHDKVILLSFPTRADFERWATSPAYQEIAQDRLAATTGTVLLVAGLAPPA